MRIFTLMVLKHDLSQYLDVYKEGTDIMSSNQYSGSLLLVCVVVWVPRSAPLSSHSKAVVGAESILSCCTGPQTKFCTSIISRKELFMVIMPLIQKAVRGDALVLQRKRWNFAVMHTEVQNKGLYLNSISLLGSEECTVVLV